MADQGDGEPQQRAPVIGQRNAQASMAQVASPPRAAFLTSFWAATLVFSMGQFHRSSGGVTSTVFAESFDLHPALLGLVIGSLFITQGMAQIPGAVLLDRYGPRLSLAFGSMIAAAGCLIVALASRWELLLLGRMLIGLGYAPVLMGSMAFLLNWVGRARVSLYTGRLLFVGMIGGVVATAPLALAMAAQGWRIVYAELAALTLLLGLAGYVILRDQPPVAAGAATAPQPAVSFWQVLLGYATVLKHRDLWPILVMGPFLYAPSQILSGLWIGPYLRDIHGIEAEGRGYALALMVAVMGLGVLTVGQIDAAGWPRKQLMRIGAALVAIFFAVLVMFGHYAAWIAIAASAIVIFSSTFYVVALAHAQSLFPPSHAGRSVGVIGVLGVSGIFFSQSLSALILAHFPGVAGSTASLAGYQLVFGIFGGIFAMLVGVTAWVRLPAATSTDST